MSLLDSLIKYVNRGQCEKLIKYQARTFEFKGITAEVAGSKITFEGMSSEVKNNIESISPTALALDDFHYHMCNDLSNPLLKENLTKEDLRLYTKVLLGAQACILNFRSALDAFKADPKNQEKNLDSSVQLIRKYVDKATIDSMTEEGKEAISEAFSSVGIDERQVDKALTKQ